jgi:hypothetical protein
MFGATLIWGTGYPSKFRWQAAWESDPGAWQSTALLAVAFAGVITVGMSLRASVAAQKRRARAMAAVAAACFHRVEYSRQLLDHDRGDPG